MEAGQSLVSSNKMYNYLAGQHEVYYYMYHWGTFVIGNKTHLRFYWLSRGL